MKTTNEKGTALPPIKEGLRDILFTSAANAKLKAELDGKKEAVSSLQNAAESTELLMQSKIEDLVF